MRLDSHHHDDAVAGIAPAGAAACGAGDERWVDVPLEMYAERYQVSDAGRVRLKAGAARRSCADDSQDVAAEISIQKDGTVKLWVPAVKGIDPETGRRGTLRASQAKKILVSRLVLMAFVPIASVEEHMPQPANGDARDARLANLRWVRRPTPVPPVASSGHLAPMARAVIGIARDGHRIGFACLADAARAGFTAALVAQCCKAGTGRHKGYRWKLAEPGEALPPPAPARRLRAANASPKRSDDRSAPKGVVATSDDGMVLHFASRAAAARAGYNAGAIWSCCAGRSRVHAGLRWSFAKAARPGKDEAA